jgi:hypothetical protein
MLFIRYSFYSSSRWTNNSIDILLVECHICWRDQYFVTFLMRPAKNIFSQLLFWLSINEVTSSWSQNIGRLLNIFLKQSITFIDMVSFYWLEKCRLIYDDTILMATTFIFNRFSLVGLIGSASMLANNNIMNASKLFCRMHA